MIPLSEAVPRVASCNLGVDFMPSRPEERSSHSTTGALPRGTVKRDSYYRTFTTGRAQ